MKVKNMIIKSFQTRIFKEGEDLFKFITEQIEDIKENSVIVVTSKIVSLSEGRTVLVKNEKEKDAVIKKESSFAMLTKYVWLTIKDGMVMPSAGVDESNANGKLILLPKDSFKSAKVLREKLKRKYKRKNIGVLITDSRTVPLRAGVTGVSLGYAGFCGIRDYCGKPDIFGRKFKFSRTNVSDSLASTAVFVMGEGNERIPLVVIEGALVEFSDRTYRKELNIDIEDDMYGPLFRKIIKK